MIVVSNSSPLISFEQLGKADLLAKLFDKVLIPPAVRQETYEVLPLPQWAEERSLSQPLSALTLRLIPAVKPLVEQLLAFGFHADEELVIWVLQSAGEK